MPMKGREFEPPPLFGPNGRIPTAQAVRLMRPSGIIALRKGWLGRHTVAMVVLSPLLFVVYQAALGSALDDAFWNLMTGGMSLVAALILTTFLPVSGTRIVPGSCALMAGLFVPGAAILLNQATGPFSGALALGLLSLGLWQRLSGTAACG